ncbi:ubiquitin-conjugating enzyme E2 S [Borealophlyctis nickersoniae]|nr:ubiquitin-conjugating enzyme E2 S [Borealophlyctis nickersoniae]
MAANENRTNLTPAVIKRISKEILLMNENPPEGILPIINEDNMTDIQAWLQGPRYFMTKLFHPNVSTTGEICVNTLKRDWKTTETIADIFLTIKSLLYDPNPDSALNEEAAKLYQESITGYFSRAKMMTKVYAMKTKMFAPSKAGEKIDAGKGLSSPDEGQPGAENATEEPRVAVEAGDALKKVSGDGVSGGVTATKKRTADKKLDKQKADKKRALKRL